MTIQDGGHLAPGPGAETLGVGNLVLNAGSILDYQLSTPGVIGSGVNSLVNVTGNLTLAGVLNVTNGGNFGSGFYRLLNYTGALTDNTLDLGTLPMGFSSANVTVTHRRRRASQPGGQWRRRAHAILGRLEHRHDLTVHGGNGTWNNFTTNFTNVARHGQRGVAERDCHLYRSPGHGNPRERHPLPRDGIPESTATR